MRRSGRNLPVLNFGKHRAKHIDEVDYGHLQWTYNEFPESDSWCKAAARVLIGREQEKSAKLNVSDLLSELKYCTRRKDLLKGRGLHTNAVKYGIDSNIYVAGGLINLYTKCGSMEDARAVFDSIQEPDVVCWNALILGYADNGQGLAALDLFSRMKGGGRCPPDSVTYLAALKACTLLAADGGESGKRECLERARQIHSEVGRHMDHFVRNTFINLYGKCGSMKDAWKVFDSIQEPDVVSWTAIILGYAENGQGSLALDLFTKMKVNGRCAPNSVTYLAALKACTLLASDAGESGKKECLERGKQIHSEIGYHINYFTQTTLINLYGKCGSMEDARTVFYSIKKPDVVCWNALILGYAENGQGAVALDLFSRMKEEGRCSPNSVTYLSALKACTFLAAEGDESQKREFLQRGRQIHSEIYFHRHMNLFAQSTLINLYGKCGSIDDARAVFDSIQEPNVVCWTAIILGYADNGDSLVALDLFSRMKKECRCAPDPFLYVAVLKACTLLAEDGGNTGKRECLEMGRKIHSEIGPHMDHFVQSTLISLYGKCGSMVDATKLFDSIQEPDAVCWNALILGHADSGQGFIALDLFSRMKDEGRCAPNSVTYLAALKACTLLATDGGEYEKRECLERGRQIHSELGCCMNPFEESTLINLYGKCGSMGDARTLFDSIQEPSVVCWTAIVLGYAENGQGLVALDLFSKMKDEGRCTPDSFAYLAALKACSSIGALAIGRKLHSGIVEFNSHVVTSLVDFYAKCGSIEEAREVFDLHPQVRDVSTWNALLAGYALIGDTGSVFSLFEKMQDQGFRPDVVTFMCVLSCCSHAGLVAKAWEYLEEMPKRYGVTATLMHYTCMIDLLGRANKLDEAVSLIQKMPCDPDAVTWTSILGACRKWKNAEIGRWAVKSLMGLDRNNASSYVLLAEMYSNRDIWEEQDKVLEARMRFGTCKLPRQDYVIDGVGSMAKFVGDCADVQGTEKQNLLNRLVSGV